MMWNLLATNRKLKLMNDLKKKKKRKREREKRRYRRRNESLIN